MPPIIPWWINQTPCEKKGERSDLICSQLPRWLPGNSAAPPGRHRALSWRSCLALTSSCHHLCFANSISLVWSSMFFAHPPVFLLFCIKISQAYLHWFIHLICKLHFEPARMCFIQVRRLKLRRAVNSSLAFTYPLTNQRYRSKVRIGERDCLLTIHQ